MGEIPNALWVCQIAHSGKMTMYEAPAIIRNLPLLKLFLNKMLPAVMAEPVKSMVIAASLR